MTLGAKRKGRSQPAEGNSVRATISFPSEIYQTLEDIAKKKKVVARMGRARGKRAIHR